MCAIHRGIAEGILDAMASDKRVEKLVAYDPRRAGCRLQLEPRPPAWTPRSDAGAEIRGGRPAA